MKLERKQFKIKKQKRNWYELFELAYKWILKNTSFEGSEHDNFSSSGSSKKSNQIYKLFMRLK
jgi:hypothetical protein